MEWSSAQGASVTKLIIQIPCLNEAKDLPKTLDALPRSIPGIDIIEILIIDDGSVDNTTQIARLSGVHHVVRHRTNRGLAAAFRSGIDAALRAGADIIVNTDADGQYVGQDIVKIITPILNGEADIVVGDRGVASNVHFGFVKRRLQQLGSAIVQRLSNTHINDAVSGFRAISREAAMHINITTEFSYTTDMLIQAGRKRLAIRSIPVGTNATTRPSRLFKSIPRFILNTGITMARAYTTYNPLRAFVGTGAVIILVGMMPILRFLFFYLSGDGAGHVQSLVLGGALLVLGALIAVMGILADLIAANRKLIEANLIHLRLIEDRLDLIQRAQLAEQQALLIKRRIA